MTTPTTKVTGLSCEKPVKIQKLGYISLHGLQYDYVGGHQNFMVACVFKKGIEYYLVGYVPFENEKINVTAVRVTDITKVTDCEIIDKYMTLKNGLKKKG